MIRDVCRRAQSPDARGVGAGVFIHRVLLVLCISSGSLLLAQSGSLTLSSGSAPTGGTASLNLALSGGSTPAGLQWTLTYPSSTVTAVNVTAGPALTAAGKSLFCAGGAGTYTCATMGLNAGVIADGVVATASITLASSAGNLSVALTNTMGVSAPGQVIPVTGTGGSIAVTPAVSLSSTTCSPSSLVTPGTSACVVRLSAPAPAGGALVTLLSNNQSLAVPASITLTAGSTSGNFTATAAPVTASQTATVTATYAGKSLTATLSMTPPTAPPVTTGSLACRPSSISPGASTACTVILSGTAPAGGTVVSLSSSSTALTTANTLTIPEGSASGTFTANAGTMSSTQTATLTASLGASSSANSVVLNPAAGPPILKVGPGQAYSTPCQAMAVAPDGAMIQIDAGSTYSGDVCTVNANNITVKGIHGRPRVDAAGQNAGGKGTWVFEGGNITVDTVELTGAVAPGNNGAAICMEGHHLNVLNAYIHDNQEGIRVNPQPDAQILVQNTEFNHNGSGDGLTHNLAVNAAARLTLQYSYSHSGNGGKLVETGASENYILYNRLTSESGTTSTEIDISNGGRSFVIGNLMEKGPDDQSASLLGYLSAGAGGANSSTELYVINNTFVNDRASGATFLDINPADPTGAIVANNIFYGPGTLITQSNAVLNANLTGDPRFTNQAGYDYHLVSGSPAINAGANPGAADGVSLMPIYEYISPACAEARNPVGAVDIGAYEFGGGGVPLPCAIGASGVSVTPTSVIAGGSATLTVSLNNPAPPDSVLVTLSSSNPGVAPLPANLAIPSGAMSANLAVTTASVTSPTSVTFSATYGGTTQTAVLTVAVQGLSLVCPASLQSGATGTCTVTVSPASQAGGGSVAVSSNNSLLSTPSAVPLAAGSTSATFNISAGSIVSSQTATVTATLGGVSQGATISLVAQTVLSGLACSPTTLGSGASSTCTVTLSAAAPAGGALISLSDNSNLLTTPSVVTVPAGSTATTFSASAGTFSGNLTATVTATFGGASATATLNLASSPTSSGATLSSLSCSPTTLFSRSASTCTVALTSAAPAGGVSISLSDNNSALTTPSSVMVAGGSTSASFRVTAGYVRRSTYVTVTATQGSISRSATLRLSWRIRTRTK